MSKDTEAMGRDLDLIDLVEAIGSKKAKQTARRQRKKIFAELHEMNECDGLNEMSDDELMKELGK